jgi:hypothetical protein
MRSQAASEMIFEIDVEFSSPPSNLPLLWENREICGLQSMASQAKFLPKLSSSPKSDTIID